MWLNMISCKIVFNEMLKVTKEYNLKYKMSLNMELCRWCISIHCNFKVIKYIGNS